MGFTLLEMIVVIGIIGILLAVMMPFLGRLRDGSLTAECKNNMQNIAKAAIEYGHQRPENDGHFPAAGFYRTLTHGHIHKKIAYYPNRPWISNKGDVKSLNETTTSVILGEVAHFTDTDEAGRFAVTNGAIWRAVGESFDVYRCPVHAKNFEKKKGRQPWWSFVMNQEFGFNRDGKGFLGFFGTRTGQNLTVAVDVAGKRTKTASRSPDKVLMFAEVQGADVNADGVSLKTLVDGGNETDAVLEYAKEEIGFTHPMGKGKYGGNVAFADGHVETIMLPVGMSRLELTRYLCQGFDVPHDGRSYTPNSTDE